MRNGNSKAAPSGSGQPSNAGRKKPDAADPYRTCELSCTHDLGCGVLTGDLVSGDGPHPPLGPVLTVNTWLAVARR